MNSKTASKTDGSNAAEVGGMMREVRENLGHDLETVASDLRIRLIYLEAIESGRLSDLPGSAYVSGFLRSYSDFLGLEGDEIVRRFKMTGAEVSSQPQLHLPSPVEEGRLPTGSIFVVGAVIAAAAYGGWYYLSSVEDGPTEIVSTLPTELSVVADEIQKQTVATDLSKLLPTASSDKESAPPKAVEAVISSEISKAPFIGALSDGNPALPPKLATVPLIGPAPVLTPSPRSTDALAKPPRLSVGSSSSNNIGRTVYSPDAPENSSSELRGEAGIVVRATADSYVAVRSGKNEPLFSQLMRSGESYAVPSRPGLFLETGNAGGLQIIIDGKRAPSLGPVGRIRRNIPLDPDNLLRGLN
jgi:cytoskeleton protein RodZ